MRPQHLDGTVRPRRKLLRVVVTGALATVLVPISWAMSLFVTPGILVAGWALPDDVSWAPSGERLGIAATVDFAGLVRCALGRENTVDSTPQRSDGER